MDYQDEELFNHIGAVLGWICHGLFILIIISVWLILILILTGVWGP